MDDTFFKLMKRSQRAENPAQMMKIATNILGLGKTAAEQKEINDMAKGIMTQTQTENKDDSHGIAKWKSSKKYLKNLKKKEARDKKKRGRGRGK